MIYVLQVKPSSEFTVAALLRRDNIAAYVPRQALLIHKSGLWTKIINILFPGYVFVDINYTHKLHHKIKCTEGVIRFLGAPTPLPQHEEGLMRWLINNGNVIEESQALINSDDVCIGFAGFLDGYEDRVVYLNRRQHKATVKVEFGGRQHKANLGIELKRAENKSDFKEQG